MPLSVNDSLKYCANFSEQPYKLHSTEHYLSTNISTINLRSRAAIPILLFHFPMRSCTDISITDSDVCNYANQPCSECGEGGATNE